MHAQLERLTQICYSVVEPANIILELFRSKVLYKLEANSTYQYVDGGQLREGKTEAKERESWCFLVRNIIHIFRGNVLDRLTSRDSWNMFRYTEKLKYEILLSF